MKHPVSRNLFRYWDGLRNGRSAPERIAIDPAAIRDILAYTFLLEIGAPCGSEQRLPPATFRLSGTRLNALFQRDLKGVPFPDIWVDGHTSAIEVLLRGVLDDRLPTVAVVEGAPPGYEPIAFELLMLPLRHHGKTHARLLGSLAAAVVPGWIGLRPASGLALSSFRTIVSGAHGRLGRFGAGARDEAIPQAGQNRIVPLHPQVPTAVGPFRVYQGGRQSPNAAPAPRGLPDRA